jgi:hypothetical protein
MSILHCLNNKVSTFIVELVLRCSDGGSRSGAFCLIDMVLKRIARSE